MIQFHLRRKFTRALHTFNYFINGHLSCYRVLGIIIFMVICYKIRLVTIPGRYTTWSVWSSCPVSCGGGISKRTRTCTNPKPGLFGRTCIGEKELTKKCNVKPCAINGKYTNWGPFDQCDKSCGIGTKTRKRNCTNPAPKYGGKNCDDIGPPEEKHFCNIYPCPIHGGYSSWGTFTGCEIPNGHVCGVGKKVRLRTCNNPVPQYKGLPCREHNMETIECEIPCPSTASSASRHTTINKTTYVDAKNTNIHTTTLRSHVREKLKYRLKKESTTAS